MTDFICVLPGDGGQPDDGQIRVRRYLCPWCLGHGRWGDGDRCHSCAGSGTTDDDALGVDLYNNYGDAEPPETVPQPIPTPPGVMRRPCVDCAYRPGSPERGEDDDIANLPAGTAGPFYCHHGMPRIGEGYLSMAYLGSRPLGAMVCAGWWGLALGEPLPAAAFRDPGGSDRREDAPDA